MYIKFLLLTLLTLSAGAAAAKTTVVNKTPVQRHGIQIGELPGLDAELIKQNTGSIQSSVLEKYRSYSERGEAIDEYNSRLNALVQERIADRAAIFRDARISVQTDPFDERIGSNVNFRTEYKDVRFVVTPPSSGLLYVSNTPKLKRIKGKAERVSSLSAKLNPDNSVGYNFKLTEPDAVESNPHVTVSVTVVYKYSEVTVTAKAKSGVKSATDEIKLQMQKFIEVFDQMNPEIIPVEEQECDSFTETVTEETDATLHINNPNCSETVVFFVHGFNGKKLETWGNLKDVLLADQSLHKNDFVFIGYNTDIIEKSSISDIALVLSTQIELYRDLHGYSKVIIVGHSMGGLVARAHVLDMVLDGRLDDAAMISKIITFATPHGGTNIAQLEGILRIFGGNKFAKEMKPFSRLLADLNRRWRVRISSNINSDWNGEVVAVAGTEDKIVSFSSARAEFPATKGVGYDHSAITKINGKSHESFRVLQSELLD